ncbi:unnamed protein product [Camellia sinensis]
MISKLLYRCKIHFSWSLYVSDHVAVSLPGGRILVSAGSMASLHSASQLYILDPTDEKPTWRLLIVLGRPLRFAWGHSISVVGGRRAIVLGGQTGEEAIKHFSKGLFHMGLILCGLDGTHIGSLYLSNLVVRASIDCEDPLCEIDGVPIGTEYCKVFVSKVKKLNAGLETTFRGLRTGGEPIGRYVMWHSIHILSDYVMIFSHIDIGAYC